MSSAPLHTFTYSQDSFNVSFPLGAKQRICQPHSFSVFETMTKKQQKFSLYNLWQTCCKTNPTKCCRNNSYCWVRQWIGQRNKWIPMKSIAPIKDSHFVPLYLILIYYSFFIILLGCKVCAVKVSSYPEPINGSRRGHDVHLKINIFGSFLWLPSWGGNADEGKDCLPKAWCNWRCSGLVLADHSGI